MTHALPLDPCRELLALFLRMERQQAYVTEMNARDGEHGVPYSAVREAQDELYDLQQALNSQLAALPTSAEVSCEDADFLTAIERDRLVRLNRWRNSRG